MRIASAPSSLAALRPNASRRVARCGSGASARAALTTNIDSTNAQRKSIFSWCPRRESPCRGAFPLRRRTYDAPRRGWRVLRACARSERAERARPRPCASSFPARSSTSLYVPPAWKYFFHSGFTLGATLHAASCAFRSYVELSSHESISRVTTLFANTGTGTFTFAWYAHTRCRTPPSRWCSFWRTSSMFARRVFSFENRSGEMTASSSASSGISNSWTISKRTDCGNPDLECAGLSSDSFGRSGR